MNDINYNNKNNGNNTHSCKFRFSQYRKELKNIYSMDVSTPTTDDADAGVNGSAMAFLGFCQSKLKPFKGR